jgi:hypothetical protein
MATEFLARCFGPEETIAILLRREEPAKIVQRIVKVEQATAIGYMRWLAHENANGVNVYVAANPLRSGSRKRTKESIAQVRHLYLDIDCDGDARLAALRTSNSIPKASAIISTSPGKYQILWRVEGFNLECQELTLKQLAISFGGDVACTDCNRVIRVPGFHNTKYTPSHPVTVEYVTRSISTPEDFLLIDGSSVAVLPPRGVARALTGKKHSHSEQDWAWVLSELANGKDAALLTHTLADRRADKPNPLYYAQRTVDLASARLALLAGIPLRDVIVEIEQRRRSEVSEAVCSARAREIAHTAAQMITRREIA